MEMKKKKKKKRTRTTLLSWGLFLRRELFFLDSTESLTHAYTYEMRHENENISRSRWNREGICACGICRGKCTFFCLFVTHAIIVSCDSLDTHKHSHSINLSLKGLHCKMTPIDGCSSSSGYTLFLNRDFLASILCD